MKAARKSQRPKLTVSSKKVSVPPRPDTTGWKSRGVTIS